MKLNYSITKTYLFSNVNLTIIASLGIVVGISVFIFLDSMLSGFDKKRNQIVFKTIPHIRIYKENKVTKPLITNKDRIGLILNPTIPNSNKKIFNPNPIIELIKNQENVLEVTPKVITSVEYKKGKTTTNGNLIGYIPYEANKVFDLKSIIIDGNFDDLEKTSNGVIVGVGIIDRLNLKVGENLTVTSTSGIKNYLKIVAIFKTNTSVVDKSQSFVNISTARIIG
ncbi:MAG: ABC transporter permease, partial [Solirubrobacteraceae bacterium]